MSCMVHICKGCNHMVFNNEFGPDKCPKCGGEMTHHWDEE